MKKEIIPNSYLFLYAKGWLRFKDSSGFIEDMRRVCAMDGNIVGENPTEHVMAAFSQIKDYLERHNVKLHIGWTNFGYFYRSAKDRSWSAKSNEYVTKLEVGMMAEVYGQLQMIDVFPELIIKWIDYKNWKCVTATKEHGETYTTMQNIFNESWRNNIMRESYDISWFTSNAINREF